MKIKILSLILLTLSLSACGVKVFKAKEQKPVDQVDITRPPAIAVSKDEAIAIARDPDEVVSYEEWLKKSSK